MSQAEKPHAQVGHSTASNDLQKTPLHALHVEAGARMVPFAGYAMPVQYPSGVLAEHRHTRMHASLFDVSHMGQIRVGGPDPARTFECFVPGDIIGLPVGRMRYTLFTSESGGILDDLMATRHEDHLLLVVNAARKKADTAYLRGALGPRLVELLEDRALLALQGPEAVDALARHAPFVRALKFLSAAKGNVAGIPCLVTRSGYTGEDGFEISVAAEEADVVARCLLKEPEVALAGLGARDSLRLEAGLCLYGHDIDETTTPIEAGLAWTIGKRRKIERGFPGAAVIMEQLLEGSPRRRVGIRPEGRVPAREGAPVLDAEGEAAGRVTSGTFGPTVGGPIAMGYVDTPHAEDGTPLGLTVHGRTVPACVVPLPFVPHRYARMGA